MRIDWKSIENRLKIDCKSIGNRWKSMKIDENRWKSMTIYEHRRKTKEINENQCTNAILNTWRRRVPTSSFPTKAYRQSPTRDLQAFLFTFLFFSLLGGCLLFSLLSLCFCFCSLLLALAFAFRNHERMIMLVVMVMMVTMIVWWCWWWWWQGKDFPTLYIYKLPINRLCGPILMLLSS